MAALINRYVTVASITLLGFAALLSSVMPASAASQGVAANCSFISTTRLQCNFPVFAVNYNADLHYVTAECTSTGAAYNLQQLQILAIPPKAAADVAYQVAGNRASVAGVANTAEIVDIHVKANTTSEALIDLSPAPSGTTSCTASVSVTY